MSSDPHSDAAGPPSSSPSGVDVSGDAAVGVVVSGFGRIVNLDDPRCASDPEFLRPDVLGQACLRWYAPPHAWPLASSSLSSAHEEGASESKEEEEGRGGSWGLRSVQDAEDGEEVTIILKLHPPAKKDFWRKTYYDPVLVKDDGPFLFYELDASERYTVEASFVLTARAQFDQAGIMIRLDHEHWIKAGIEVVDLVPRLSCVVTNAYSDWSTQPWHTYEETAFEDPQSGDKARAVVVTARVRVHCRQGSFVVEAYADNHWEFIRICHLSRGTKAVDDPLQEHPNVISAWQGPPAPDGTLWAGVFGACPVRVGAEIEFRHFSIVKGSEFDHNAD
jgi:regulation of enolase protein 1 (concanavalin A-like superfamily)